MSGLYRDKWERDDYRQRTIQKALVTRPRSGGNFEHRVHEPSDVQPTRADRLQHIHAVQADITSSPYSRDIIELSLAVATSWRLSFQDETSPVWMMVCGAPSSDKTRTVDSLHGAVGVTFADTFTENGLLSGYEDRSGTIKRGGLLAEMEKGTLVMKDLTTMFSLREERIKKLLGEFQGVFYGRLVKQSGLGPKVEWVGHIALIGCITPQTLVQHYRYMSRIGSRFLFYRVPTQTAEEHREGFKMNKDRAFRKAKLAELRGLVHEHIQEVLSTAVQLEDEPAEVDSRLESLAEFLAAGRALTVWQKDRDNEWFIEGLQKEEPYRIMDQLRTLVRSLANVRGRRS
jgi:hypothetical protein